MVTWALVALGLWVIWDTWRWWWLRKELGAGLQATEAAVAALTAQDLIGLQALDDMDARHLEAHALARKIEATANQAEYALLEQMLATLKTQDEAQHAELMQWLTDTSHVIAALDERHGVTHTFVKQLHATPNAPHGRIR